MDERCVVCDSPILPNMSRIDVDEACIKNTIHHKVEIALK
jgi:hypothetical protein